MSRITLTALHLGTCRDLQGPVGIHGSAHEAAKSREGSPIAVQNLAGALIFACEAFPLLYTTIENVTSLHHN